MMWRIPKRKNCFVASFDESLDLMEFVHETNSLFLFSREGLPASMNSKISTQTKDMQVMHHLFGNSDLIYALQAKLSTSLAFLSLTTKRRSQGRLSFTRVSPTEMSSSSSNTLKTLRTSTSCWRTAPSSRWCTFRRRG